MSEITLMSWNVGGATFLKSSPSDRVQQRDRLTTALAHLTKVKSLDVVLLQEIARYGSSGSPDDLVVPPEDYYYRSFVAIDTLTTLHPKRWDRVRDEGQWSKDDYLAQGYGILWRKTLPHASLWSEQFRVGEDLDAEVVHLQNGLYTGSRDSEPRLAIVAHFYKEPLEFLVVNLHLTTLQRERRGVLDGDAVGSVMRLAQIELVLRGIVSRYNEWRTEGEKEPGTRPRPVWLLCGDFNCLPGSPEVRRIEERNFRDLHSASRGSGTKSAGKGVDPTITVDYIFAGPIYAPVDPHMLSREVAKNASAIVDLTTKGISDHYPIIATISSRAVLE